MTEQFGSIDHNIEVEFMSLDSLEDVEALRDYLQTQANMLTGYLAEMNMDEEELADRLSLLREIEGERIHREKFPEE